MQAPRLRVGVFSDSSNFLTLGEDLASVGHQVRFLDAPREINDYELIVIDVKGVETCVEELSAFVRQGQMFLLASMVHSITVLDPLEIAGGIVMSAYPLGHDRWVASSVDELGETIVGLLVGELGGSVIEVDESQRQQLAAALTYAGFMNTLRNDAMYFLDEFLGDIEVATDIVNDAKGNYHALLDLEALTAQYDAISNPGRKRLFRDLARRKAEISRAQDVELWAIQKEDR